MYIDVVEAIFRGSREIPGIGDALGTDGAYCTKDIRVSEYMNTPVACGITSSDDSADKEAGT
jgi:hypothetical protein